MVNLDRYFTFYFFSLFKIMLLTEVDIGIARNGYSVFNTFQITFLLKLYSYETNIYIHGLIFHVCEDFSVNSLLAF